MLRRVRGGDLERGETDLERGASLPGPAKSTEFISKGRLDALTDGVYAFAMTLLVVNIELPENFDPKTNRQFLEGVSGLADTFTAYLITFLVLASFWLSRARATGGPETASAAYAWATILHLFPVTFMPFAMLVAGRYDYPGAIWIYGGNMILLAVSVMAISLAGERRGFRRGLPDGSVELGILVGSALLSMAMSLFAPGYAMLPYLLNLATPLAARAVDAR